MLQKFLDIQLAWYVTAAIGFFAVFFADIVWVLYIRWSSQGRAVRAGALSAVLVFNSWIGLLVVLGSPYVAIPSEVLGAFCGTVVAINLDRSRGTEKVLAKCAAGCDNERAALMSDTRDRDWKSI